MSARGKPNVNSCVCFSMIMSDAAAAAMDITTSEDQKKVRMWNQASGSANNS